jgi:hypothetical protein
MSLARRISLKRRAPMNNSKQLVRDLTTGEVTSLVSDLGRLALRRTSNCASDQNVLTPPSPAHEAPDAS